MTSASGALTVLVPVNAITVVNPRVRNQKVFDEITANIAELGLKRPITVAARELEGDSAPTYELVCGQGRLEAFKALGQSEIPAIVINASSEDCLVMSLVENLARRQHRGDRGQNTALNQICSRCHQVVGQQRAPLVARGGRRKNSRQRRGRHCRRR